MEIDQKLREFEARRDRNWQSIIFVLRKHLDSWAYSRIIPEWGNMKISYMPVICNIGADGTTATEIAARALIAKQAMSRTIRELEDKGMIYSMTDPLDKRIERLFLTESGKKLVCQANMELDFLTEQYIKEVGSDNFNTALNVISKIIKYHQKI